MQWIYISFQPFLDAASVQLFLFQSQHYPIYPCTRSDPISFFLWDAAMTCCLGIFLFLDTSFLASWFTYLSFCWMLLLGMKAINIVYAVYSHSLIKKWRVQRMLLTNCLWCYLVDSLNADRVSMLRCFEAAQFDNCLRLVIFFSASVEHVYVNNCANTHISKNWKHFVTFQPLRRGLHDRVSTVGGDVFLPE